MKIEISIRVIISQFIYFKSKFIVIYKIATKGSLFSMIINNKILETYMDIGDANDIYSPNIDAMLIKKLTAKFAGICYNSCHIIKINKIIRRSYMYMKDTLDGDCNTSIRFEATVIVYAAGEIINGCAIIKKEPNGIIHAKSKYAGLQLSVQTNMNIFNEGDVVPAIVKRVRYNVNQPSISVSATPFIPTPYKHTYHKTSGELDKSQVAELTSLINDIKSMLKQLTQLPPNSKKIYKFFLELLYNTDAIKNPVNSAKISIEKLLSVVNDQRDCIIYIPNTPYNDTDVVYIEPKFVEDLVAKTTNEAIYIVEESLYITLYTIILKQLSNLQTIKDFIEFYPDFKAVQKNKAIWKLYTMLKKTKK